MIRYKGRGEHSVRTLEVIVEDQLDKISELTTSKYDVLEMLNSYLSDLHNLIPRSDAQRSRVLEVEDLIDKLQK